jgi:uncharacterized RDD family membrane protein YckC
MSETSIKLKQKNPREKFKYAGLGVRLVAWIIDIIIVIIIIVAIGFVLLTLFPGTFISTDPSNQTISLVAVSIAACVQWLYEAGFQSTRYMGTPGKMIMGLAVADKKGHRISFTRATIRHIFKSLIPNIIAYFAQALSFLAFVYYAGDIFFLVSQDNKQSVHDMIAGTVVIHKYDTYGNSII